MIQSVRDENFTGSSKKYKDNNSYQVNLVNGTNKILENYNFKARTNEAKIFHDT